MSFCSVTHFNLFVDIHHEYASYRRGIVEGLEDILNINEEITKQLTQTMENHDRRSLSKKFPKSLLAMPASLLNPAAGL